MLLEQQFRIHFPSHSLTFHVTTNSIMPHLVAAEISWPAETNCGPLVQLLPNSSQSQPLEKLMTE